MSSLELMPLTEAMVPETVDLYIEAFRPNPMNRCMMPEITPEVRQRLYEQAYQGVRGPPKADEHNFVVVDTSLLSTNPAVPEGVIVARGTWKLETEGVMWRYPIDQIAIEGGNRKAYEAFFGAMDDRRNRIVAGRRLWHLAFLFSSVKHTGRGAARCLIEWGTRQADEMGLEAYLNSTPMAMPLYKKMGFEIVETGEQDMAPLGGEGMYTSYAMLRQPKKLQ